MPRPFSALLRRAILAAVGVIAAAAAVAFAISSRAGGSFAVPRQPSHAQPTRGRVEAEVITIRPSGFDPAEITRPRGRFYLVVENRSGTHDLDLRLSREAGLGLAGVRIPRGRLRWRDALDLPPGTYVLTEAGHPGWACRLTITPN